MSAAPPRAPIDQTRSPGHPKSGAHLDETAIALHGGIFLVAVSTLVYEIVLTRIFSVTMWYHFAFLAVSAAMFGMTAGALYVFLRPAEFIRSRVPDRLGFYSLLFSVSILAAVVGYILIQRIVEGLPMPWAWSAFLALTYPVMAMPFVLSGVVVTVTLTGFPSRSPRLYAFDLAGAACGCVLVSLLLSMTDCFATVLVAGGIAAAGGFSFARFAGATRLLACAALLCTTLFLFASIHTAMFKDGHPLMRLHLVKEKVEPQPLYECWNSFSRISVWPRSPGDKRNFGWGLSSAFRQERSASELHLEIDGMAATVLTRFTGDRSQLNHLRFDVTNVAHYLRPLSDVLVVGVGGGRDILSALAFDQKSVTGVEINDNIIRVLTDKFADYTGNLHQVPGVQLINDDARSFVARSRARFDIIQISLIDTWAATASGGLALTENSLYTKEAWASMLNHLTDHGLLSVSRWHTQPVPGEVWRLATLARSALVSAGAANPAAHIIIIKNRLAPDSSCPDAVATMLVGKTPFSDADIDKMARICSSLDFDLVLAPGRSSNGTLLDLVTASPERTADRLGLNLAPPTDDRPYFFQMMTPAQLLRSLRPGELTFHYNAIFALTGALAVMLVLTAGCIIQPLIGGSERVPRAAWNLVLYFLSIGAGFMIIEIAQMQRLSVFLGNPTWSLTVVLFSLLVAGGAGSLSTENAGAGAATRHSRWRLWGLVTAVATTGALTPALISMFQSADMLLRIGVSVAITMPMGYFMGMAFPLGIKSAASFRESVTPWLWGLSGASSVCASLVAAVIALSAGIHASYMIGVAFYSLALWAYLKSTATRLQAAALDPGRLSQEEPA